MPEIPKPVKIWNLRIESRGNVAHLQRQKNFEAGAETREAKMGKVKKMKVSKENTVTTGENENVEETYQP